MRKGQLSYKASENILLTIQRLTRNLCLLELNRKQTYNLSYKDLAKGNIVVLECKVHIFVILVSKMFPHPLTHISLASLLWDIGKQYSPRCDAAERGVPSGAILCA